MIEIPAAAACRSQFARSCDFFNLYKRLDFQYTMAAARMNEQVIPLPTIQPINPTLD